MGMCDGTGLVRRFCWAQWVFMARCRHSMLRMSLAPCSPFSVDNELMIKAAEMARQHPGVRLHTHLAENQEDIDYSLKVYGCRPGEYLKCAAVTLSSQTCPDMT